MEEFRMSPSPAIRENQGIAEQIREFISEIKGKNKDIG